MQITDAHLDLAYNVTLGRDITRPAREQPPVRDQIATVGIPDLRAGGVNLICATIFCEPFSDLTPHGYQTADEAFAQAIEQFEIYERLFDGEHVRPVRSGSELSIRASGEAPVGAILLLEGADAIRSIDDVQLFFGAGVRIVGLAWKRTRYAGGTGTPGKLTDDGVALVRELDRFGMIHDASHLAEESFWHLLEISGGPIIASHSNCKSIVGGESNRHLTDDMIRAIAKRGGVIGINFFDKFLLPIEQYGKRRATLNDVVAHVKHICDLTGSADHVGIGTDMDGGLGREEIPVEIQSSADLPRLADALAAANVGDADIGKIMSQNWQRYFARQFG